MKKVTLSDPQWDYIVRVLISTPLPWAEVNPILQTILPQLDKRKPPEVKK